MKNAKILLRMLRENKESMWKAEKICPPMPSYRTFENQKIRSVILSRELS